jgi:hypothetical protein
MADAPARGPRRGPAHHDPVEKPPINAAERLPIGRPRPSRFAVVAISRQAATMIWEILNRFAQFGVGSLEAPSGLFPIVDRIGCLCWHSTSP